jgi:hypothetical protein
MTLSAAGKSSEDGGVETLRGYEDDSERQRRNASKSLKAKARGGPQRLRAECTRTC